MMNFNKLTEAYEDMIQVVIEAQVEYEKYEKDAEALLNMVNYAETDDEISDETFEELRKLADLMCERRDAIAAPLDELKEALKPLRFFLGDWQ